MKYSLISVLLILFIFAGCSKKSDNQKLTAYNSQAFAYDLGNSYEVDATTRVKGFVQNENDGNFSASLSYDVDLIKPGGDTVKSIISKISDKSQKEKFSDTSLEIQFELDSTYTKGNYEVVINVKDVNSDKTSSTTANFKLGE